ncbi:SipW-dependent-type signal peptide-containing protein [Thermococcus sp.]|uniref:SipW-dependent-type signal peptide-containing protein n=1 Tax=Thermococcus sp. TaxID=35749 RepID=UPI002603AE33|nr:SipW-dependent-type signal peptide-containing protein [Thermococcus sp.]
MRSALFAFFLVGIVVLAVGYGTWAYFSDIEVSAGDYVTADTLDLVLTDHTSDANAQWGYFYIAPGRVPGVNGGYSGGDRAIHIFNNGTYPNTTVEIWFTFECYEDNDGNYTNGLQPGPESDTLQTNESAYLMLNEITLNTMEYTDSQAVRLIYDKKLTSSGYDYLAPELKSEFSPGQEITLADLARMKFVGLPGPEPLYGTLDTSSSQYLDEPNTQLSLDGPEGKMLNSSQNYWQGDVCIMTVHVRLVQSEP